MRKKSKKSKVNNQRSIVDEKTFASKKEAKRYCELVLLQRGGIIQNLECQPKIPLIVNGKKIGVYIGDFSYFEKGDKIIEDVKSPITKTPVYNLKKKILSTYSPPILIKEVM